MSRTDDAKHALIRQQMAAEESALTPAEGHFTPRQRLAKIFDGGAYRELFRYARSLKDSQWQDGVICAHGMVHGRPAMAYATEFQTRGGSLGVQQTRQIAEVLRLARQSGIPVLALLESGGARISEAVHIMEGFVPPMKEAVYSSGIVPQIACIFGPCIGASAFMATLSDFVIMEAESTLSIAGARVNQAATGEVLTESELGGVAVHTQFTGNAHFVCQGEAATLLKARELLRWLPANHSERPPQFVTTDPENRMVPEIKDLIPEDTSTCFDMKDLIQSIADQSEFFEVQAEFAPNMLTGFAAFGGQTMAVVANQSMHLAGALDADGARKLSRFLNFIANFNYPLLTLVDVPGAMPTLEAQKQGILTHTAQIIHALYHVRGLKISIVVRRCFGGTYALISPKSGEGDLIFAYPNAMIGVMSDAAMTAVMSQNKNAKAKADQLHAQGLRLDDPLLAASSLYLDDILQPEETRCEIIRALKTFGNKQVEHFPRKLLTNPPL